MEEAKISTSHEMEALPSLCEIRFDCLVRMFEPGFRTVKTGFFGWQEKPLPPQWFKSEMKLTLEAIRHGDEYAIGRQLKVMLEQLDDHIKKWEEKKITAQ